MDSSTSSLTSAQRRLEPADITQDKTQVVLNEGAQDLAGAAEARAAELPGNEGVTIQSVDRALSILELVAEASEPLKLQEIAQTLGLKTPTCYHLLNSLVKRGFVTRNAHPRSYHLGHRIGEIARRDGAHFDIRRAALPHLMALRDATGQSTCMAVFSGTELIIAAEAEAIGGVSVANYRLQLERAAHATALGKAILAWLPEPQIARVVADRGLAGFTDLTIVSLGELVESLRQVRRHGFAVDGGEYDPQIFSLAAAIRDPAGGVIGAVGCLGLRKGDELPHLRELQSKVSATAKVVSDLCR